VSVSPPSDTDLATRARGAFEGGLAAWSSADLPAAKAAFENALTLAPKMARAEYALGCVLERMGDAEGALSAYRAAIAADPADERTMGALALLLARTGAASQAEAFLQEMRTKAPQSVQPTVFLAEVKSMGGDSAAAQGLLQEILRTNARNLDALLGVARDHHRAKRPELAMRALAAILQGEPGVPARDVGNPEALVLRGLIERDEGLPQQAVDDFRHALATQPDLFEAHMNLGELELTMGNASEAQPNLEKAVRYAPRSALAHLYLGDCYRMLGRAADAKAELDEALYIDPNLASAHYELGVFYLSAQSAPWSSDAPDRIAKAITELEMYKSAPRPPVVHERDDVDDRLNYAHGVERALQAADAGLPYLPPFDAYAATASGIRSMCAQHAEDGIKKCQLLVPRDPSDCVLMCLDEYREAHAPKPAPPPAPKDDAPWAANAQALPSATPAAPSANPPPSPADPYFLVLGQCIRRVREGDTRPACSFFHPLDQMTFGQSHCDVRCAELTAGFRAAR
jgi:tetratricopeptide (TPR) repeat protein